MLFLFICLYILKLNLNLKFSFKSRCLREHLRLGRCCGQRCSTMSCSEPCWSAWPPSPLPSSPPLSSSLLPPSSSPLPSSSPPPGSRVSPSHLIHRCCRWCSRPRLYIRPVAAQRAPPLVPAFPYAAFAPGIL